MIGAMQVRRLIRLFDRAIIPSYRPDAIGLNFKNFHRYNPAHRRDIGIWKNHISKRVGQLRLREFRTVDAGRMPRCIALDHNLSKTSLQHIKSVLSGIFTYAKNEGAFDGANPVQGALIPKSAREAGWSSMVRLARVPSRNCVQPIRVGGQRQNRAEDPAPCPFARL